MRQRNSLDPFGSIKASLKNWLLPHPFKITGQILLFAVLVALVIQIVVTNVLPDDGANTNDRIIADVSVFCHNSFLLIFAA